VVVIDMLVSGASRGPWPRSAHNDRILAVVIFSVHTAFLLSGRQTGIQSHVAPIFLTMPMPATMGLDAMCGWLLIAHDGKHRLSD
jgi:hypothetical protein